VLLLCLILFNISGCFQFNENSDAKYVPGKAGERLHCQAAVIKGFLLKRGVMVKTEGARSCGDISPKDAI
jgi:hypothetical protein